MGDPILALDDAQLTLAGNAGPVEILRGISLTVDRGETVGLVGPSGSGKSSLLMLMGGLERATAGQVRALGQDLGVVAFVDAGEVSFVYLERPYYVAPINKGQKVYALLRDTLAKAGKIGIAKVVIQTKQHLAVLIPCGRALILNLLRWGGEIRSFEQLDLPPLGVKAAGIKDAEMTMAMQLIEDMTQPWKADEFRNSFADEINKLVEIKANKGELADVAKVDKADEGAPSGANVLDLTALLKRSLGAARSPKEKPASVTELPTAKPAPAGKAAAKKKPAAKKAAPASKAAAKKPARRAA